MKKVLVTIMAGITATMMLVTGCGKGAEEEKTIEVIRFYGSTAVDAAEKEHDWYEDQGYEVSKIYVERIRGERYYSFEVAGD